MNIIYFFDEDDKYGAPKTGMEMIYSLKEKFNVTPIVLTSKKNKVNEWCDINGIENYVTYHHKFTFVETNSKINNIIKFFPRLLRYKIGNIIAVELIKKYIDMSKIDLIHSNNSGLDIGIILSKKYKIPNVMHIREFGDLDFNMKSYRKNYINFLNKGVTKFIAISNAIKLNWIKKGIDENKVQTIYNGVNCEGIARKINYKKLDKNFKIIMIGSISPGKGQIELVEAITKVKKEVQTNLKVDIIGSGYKENEELLIRKIENNNLKDIVTWKSYDSEIKTKIKDYDIGIICSNAEGFGRVTVEYMIAGIGIIASNTGANKELITDNIDGYIYTKGNIDELARKIEMSYDNRNKINDMVKKSFEKYKKNFTTEIFSNNIYLFYKEILR